MNKETKAGPAFVLKADQDQGIVEAIFSVFGNVDNGGDIVHPGAFSKTFAEAGLQVRILDQHRTDSVARALGKPLELREIGREELPADLLEQFPDATGGALAKVQFLMSTPEGSGAFERIKEGVISQWSFAFQPLDADFSEMMQDGEPRTVRNLRTVKLFEISPVLFGMNEATTTTSAKEDDEDFQAKPWASFPTGDQFCVFRINAQHEQIGESLGCHATAEEADAQVRALFASEEDAGKAKSDEKAVNLSAHVSNVRDAIDAQFNPPDGPWDWWAREVFDEYVIVSFSGGDSGTEYFQVPYMVSGEGNITFAPRSDWIQGTFEFIPVGAQKDNAPPPDAGAAEIEQDDEKEAGPDTEPPTSEDVLVEIRKEIIEAELLEVRGYGS